MSLINLFINLLGGGATGYITNAFAVKMIFKKYGPLGGVILATREEFTENISQLVEREIINNRTIESELGKEAFRQVFRQIIADLLGKHLPEQADGIDMVSIPDIEPTCAAFLEFYKNNTPCRLEKLFHTLSGSIRLSDLAGERQRAALSQKIWDIGLAELKNSSLIENLLLNFCREHSEQQLTAFIEPQICRSVMANLVTAWDGLHIKLKRQFEPQIDRTIESAYERLELDAMLTGLVNNIRDKQLVELLGRENTQDLACEMLEQSIKLLKSNDGRQILNVFSANVFRLLKGTEVSIYSLLDDRIEGNLETYLQEKLPDLVAKIIVWIKNNKQQLEELINRSVEDVLTAEGGFQGKVKKFLKDIFIVDVAREYEVVAKIIEFIETDTDIQAMSVEITNTIIAYLKRSNSFNYINDLGQKKILKPEYLTRLILNNVDHHLVSLNLGLLDYFLSNKLGDLIDDDLAMHLRGYIKKVLVGNLKTKYLFDPKSTMLLQGVLAENMTALTQAKLGQLTSPEKFADLAGLGEQAILAGLSAHQGQLVTVIDRSLGQVIADRTLADLVNTDLRRQASLKLACLSQNEIRKLLRGNPGLKLRELCLNLSSRQQVIDALTDLVLELLKSNMQIILEGQIEQAVADNLARLNDAQLQIMVEEFMGKELKPITLFGGILGTLVALGTYLIQGGLQLEAGPASNLAMTVAVYGFIGYLTNVVALKMLFRPYKQWKFLGLKVPFTPGVVAKQKPRLAESMGDFVERDLLNADAVTGIFRSKRQELEAVFSAKMHNDNYRILQQMLMGNSDFLADKATVYVLAYMQNNKFQIMAKLLPELAKLSMSGLDYDLIFGTVQAKSKLVLQRADEHLVPHLEGILGSQKSLNDVLPQFVKDLIFEQINGYIAEKLQELLDYIKDDAKIEALVASVDDALADRMEKNIYDLLTERQRKYINDATGSYLINKIKSPEVRKSLLVWAEDRLSREIAPDKRIGDLFGGFIIRLLRQNSDFILNNVIGTAEHRLQGDRENIKDKINCIIADKGIWAWLAGRALNLPDSVDSIVDDLVDHKLPGFMQDKQAELGEIVNGFIDGLERTRVGELGVNLNFNGIMQVIDRLLTSSSLARVVKGLSDQFVESVLQLPAKELFRIVDINSSFDVYKLLAGEIKTCRNELTIALAGQDTVLVNDVGTLVREMTEKVLLQQSVAQFVKGIEVVELAGSVQRIIDALTAGDFFAAHWERYINAIMGSIKDRELGEILDSNLLKEDTLSVLGKITGDTKAVTVLREVSKDAVNALAGEINQILAPATKGYLAEVLLQSTLDAVDGHFYDLLRAVNIKQVTEREINDMDAQKIEALIYSFAKPYFSKIEMYGWLGGGIGLLTGIPVQFLQTLAK